MTRRKSNEEFKREVYDLVGDEYVFLEPYKGTKLRHRVKHVLCGTIFETKPVRFLRGQGRCQVCFKKKPTQWNTESFSEKVKSLTDGEFSLVGEYVNASDKVDIRHLRCGTLLKISPTGFLSGTRCRHCYESSWLSEEDVASQVFANTNGEYSYEGGFKNSRSKMLVRHTLCKNTFSVTPDSFNRKGTRCPKCSIAERSSKRAKTLGEFSKEVAEFSGGEYAVVGDYVNVNTKTEFYHKTCGTITSISPSNFINGYTKCSSCYSFRGEKAVSDVLDSLSIEYSREHTFEYLGRKRYDFFIPSLNIAIEYDGEQHFKAVDHWGGEEALKRTQESDALKNDFCDFMGIDLLRIPYWEFDNIDEIVTNFIDTVKLMRSISANGSYVTIH